MKRLSAYNDGVCSGCGKPAAEGVIDSTGLWCQRHGRIRAVQAFERAAFDLLHTFPAELAQAFGAVLRHREGRFDLVSDELARASAQQEREQ